MDSALSKALWALDVIGQETFVSQSGWQKSNNPLLIVWRIANTLMGLVGIVLILTVLYAGWLYMFSQGNETQTENAKKIFGQAVVGTLILFASYAITIFVIYTIMTLSGGTFLPFEWIGPFEF